MGRTGTVAVVLGVGLMMTACETQQGEKVPSRVLTGIDVLERDGFAALRGRRVGLITNHTGINRRGASTARLLHEAEGVELVALFSPEHGFRGDLEADRVADGRDPDTGLRVLSLYGESRKPTPDMLEGIDTLVFDIQDVGTRFYTYISTMGLAMRAAADQGLRFVVLDRPNPINGVGVAGPVLDAGRGGFVGFHRLPVRHGMTVGELARMFAAEQGLGLDLGVVACEGWRRGDLFDATGLPWVNPSPNIRSLTQALLYPAIGLLENTNVSVGRGTDTPFELLGAPWLDGKALARALAAEGLAGIRFEPVAFTPAASKLAGERCGGIRAALTDRARFRPVRTGLAIARQLRLLYPEAWDAAACDRLLRHEATLAALLAARPVADIEALWQPDLDRFLVRRARCLLYK